MVVKTSKFLTSRTQSCHSTGWLVGWVFTHFSTCIKLSNHQNCISLNFLFSLFFFLNIKYFFISLILLMINVADILNTFACDCIRKWCHTLVGWLGLTMQPGGKPATYTLGTIVLVALNNLPQLFGHQTNIQYFLLSNKVERVRAPHRG